MQLKDFFVKSAERSNENYLSDVTWALMETVPKFREDFLKFFDFEFVEPIEVQREYNIEGTILRVDFCIITNEKIFLIDNKVFDMKYHIKDYSRAAKKLKITKLSSG